MSNKDSDVLLEAPQALDGYFEGLLQAETAVEPHETAKVVDLQEDLQELSAPTLDLTLPLTVETETSVIEHSDEIIEIEAPALEEDVLELSLEVQQKPQAEPNLQSAEEVLPVVVDVDVVPGSLDQLVITEPEVTERVEQKQAAQEDETPVWARERFQCVSLKIGEMQVLIPLVGLKQFHATEGQSLKSLFSQANWVLGMMKTLEGYINVVDIGAWLLPKASKTDVKDLPQAQFEDYEFVLELEGSGLGICCNDLGFAEFLMPTEINWHKKDAKRPWLAGMVIDRMCGLIDPFELAAFLDQSSTGQTSKKPSIDYTKG